MPTGKVKWFDELKGYGFIVPDERGKDIFLHRSGIASGLKGLPENARVEYDLAEGRRGPQAVNVTIIDNRWPPSPTRSGLLSDTRGKQAGQLLRAERQAAAAGRAAALCTGRPRARRFGSRPAEQQGHARSRAWIPPVPDGAEATGPLPHVAWLPPTGGDPGKTERPARSPADRPIHHPVADRTVAHPDKVRASARGPGTATPSPSATTRRRASRALLQISATCRARTSLLLAGPVSCPRSGRARRRALW
jgi:CspA family cold shock protein